MAARRLSPCSPWQRVPAWAALLVLGARFPFAFTAQPALADVMEVNGNGARWVTGGPAQAAVHRTEPRAPDVPPAGWPPAGWAPVVAALAARYDLAPALIEALVWQESRWRADAVSPKGARGLAQLMPGTARALGADADDPVANIDAGARYLRSLLNLYDGDLDKALAAYNAGPARVARAGGVPAIAETRNYVAGIMARLAARTESSEIEGGR